MKTATWLLCGAAVIAGFACPVAVAQNEPVSVERVLKMADAGDVEAAAGLAKALVAERPRDVDVHVVYQDLTLRLDGRKNLLRDYKALALREGAGPDDAYLYARLLEGRVAVTEHRRTLKLNDGHVRTLLALGDLHLLDGALDDAAAVFTRAANAAPNLAIPRLGLAEVRRREGDLEAAEEFLRGAVAAQPACVLAQVELAILLAETVRYDDARAVLELAATLDPEDPLPAMALGHLERMLGRDSVALQEFETRRKAEVEAALAAADSAVRQAVEKGEEPPKQEPPEPVGTAAQRAMGAFQEAVRVAPTCYPALLLLAHTATAAGDNLTAASALRTAQGLRLGAPEPGTFRARLELDQDLVAEAEASASGVLSAYRDLCVALYLRGVALSRLGGGRKAEKDLERAVKLSGDAPLYLRGLAALHAANARWRDAIKIYERVVRATDAAPRVVFELALAQRGAGKPKEAASCLEALVADDADNRDAWLLLGRIYREDIRKMEQRALECLLRYQELGGDHPDVPDWVAELQSY